MSKLLYFDLETVPPTDQKALARIAATAGPPPAEPDLEAVANSITAPRNYGAEAAAKWKKDKQPALVAKALSEAVTAHEKAMDAYQESLRGSGLDPLQGEVYCVAAAFEDEVPQVFYRTDIGMSPQWHEDRGDDPPRTEVDVLDAFFAWMREACYTGAHYERYVPTGWNSNEFDVPFVWKRALITGARSLPNSWPRPQDIKPWGGGPTVDVMAIWTGSPRVKLKMDVLADVFGLATKDETDGISGADVAREVAAGRGMQVAEYCVNDVIRVRQLHRIMLGQRAA